MQEAGPPLGSSAEDWAATPGAVRVLVRELRQRLVNHAARLNQTSQHSCKPPSSDPPQARLRRPKEPSGRKTGGQPGPTGHHRQLKPESEVAHLIDVRPERCGQCGTLLLGEEAAPERQQDTAEAIAKRLLVATMACVVVWQLAHSEEPDAGALRQLLVRLSGRQMKWGTAFTEPALLAGLGVLLVMLDVMEQYDIEEIKRLAGLFLLEPFLLNL